MKRTIVVASCLVVLCLAGLAGWLYTNRTMPVKSPERQSASNGDRASDKAAKPQEKADATPVIYQLPVLIAYRSDDQYFPCYYDQGNKTLYHWKGVVLRADQAPDPVFVISGRMMPDAKDYTVVPFEAPVKYREVDGGYQPGYFDWSFQQFYAWKGVVLRKGQLLEKSQDGKDALLDRNGFGRVIEIDMPTHLKDHPELWKKS